MTPSHPAPPPPSADITGPHTTPSVHLLWHVCHLCNVLLCQFGAYLSLESLNRDTNATGMMPIIEYQPVMASQALMMVDVAKNIEAATDALVRTPAHQDLVNDPCYRSMLDASHALGPIIELVKVGAQSKEDVEILRKSYDEMVELCYGSEANGIVGWRGVWNEVFGYKER